jgi:hypothetical protein
VPREPRTEALYRRLEEAVLQLNAQYFRFDLSGLAMFQYAVYGGPEGGISSGTRIMAAMPAIPIRNRAN